MKYRVEKNQPENITGLKTTTMEMGMCQNQNYLYSLVDIIQRRRAQCLGQHEGLIINYMHFELRGSLFIDLFQSADNNCCKLFKKINDFS